MFEFFVQLGHALQGLMYAGGEVLKLLFLVSIVLWVLILERAWYFHRHKKTRDQEKAQLTADRAGHTGHEAVWIRRMRLSELHLRTHRGIDVIACLIMICPLLGLLGTITGMMELFHTLSITGSNSARSLSSGIARATLPTMGGLMVALSGYYAVLLFKYYAKREEQALHRHEKLRGSESP